MEDLSSVRTIYVDKLSDCVCHKHYYTKDDVIVTLTFAYLKEGELITRERVITPFDFIISTREELLTLILECRYTKYEDDYVLKTREFNWSTPNGEVKFVVEGGSTILEISARALTKLSKLYNIFECRLINEPFVYLHLTN